MSLVNNKDERKSRIFSPLKKLFLVSNFKHLKVLCIVN